MVGLSNSTSVYTVLMLTHGVAYKIASHTYCSHSSLNCHGDGVGAGDGAGREAGAGDRNPESQPATKQAASVDPEDALVDPRPILVEP